MPLPSHADIANWVAARGAAEFTADDVLAALGMPSRRRTRAVLSELGRCLHTLGYRPHQARRGGRRVRLYRRAAVGCPPSSGHLTALRMRLAVDIDAETLVIAHGLAMAERRAIAELVEEAFSGLIQNRLLAEEPRR